MRFYFLVIHIIFEEAEKTLDPKGNIVRCFLVCFFFSLFKWRLRSCKLLFADYRAVSLAVGTEKAPSK